MLYSLAYAIKMEYKSGVVKGEALDDVTDFSVYPLEGVWRQAECGELVKENLEYNIMIRQPDFITRDMINAALEKVKKKKPSPLLEEVRFSSMQDGTCIEILHIGSYDKEPESFQKMDQFAKQNKLERVGDCHREIYLSNAKRCQKSRLKTILRYRVK